MPNAPTSPPDVMARAGRLCLTTDRTMLDIAREIGVPHATLCSWARKYGWRRPGRAAGLLYDAGRPDGAPVAIDPDVLFPPRAARPPRPQRPRLKRRAAVPGEGGPGPSTSASARAATPADLAQKLEAVAARAITVLEAQVQAGKGLDPERTAKALSALTQTLKLVAGLGSSARPEGAEGEGGTTEPPRSLAELRAELLRHCRRIRAPRRPRGGADDVHPG